MEFANKPVDPWDRPRPPVTPPNFLYERAQNQDKKRLEQFLENAFFRHLHADWYDPLFWIEEPAAAALISRQGEKISGCLIAAPDPPPAAWIRAAAFDYVGLSRQQVKTQFVELVYRASDFLMAAGIEQLCWMSPRRWAEPWLADAGFHIHTTMVTYRKDDMRLPTLPVQPVEFSIRQVLPEDMRRLAKVEEATYGALWRHSARGLQRAWHQAFFFTVAVWEGDIVGFQHTTRANEKDAHLARISIHPDYQGLRIGSHLLADAIRYCRQSGIKTITLNTQQENSAAQKLYARFGFKATPYRWPLSTLEISQSG